MLKEVNFLNANALRDKMTLTNYYRNEMSLQAQALVRDIDEHINDSVSTYGVMFREYYIDLDHLKKITYADIHPSVRKSLSKDLFKDLDRHLFDYYRFKGIKVQCFFSTNQIIFELI